MPTSKKIWAALSFLSIIIIIISGIIIWSKLRPEPPLEILLNNSPESIGEVNITGAVHSPGIYPLNAGDTLPTLLQAAGGLTTGALPSLTLQVPDGSKQSTPQKIDINRADAWLLEALPDIGETRAKAIIDYRTRNGKFASISDLAEVDGISAATLDKIREFITVAE